MYSHDHTWRLNIILHAQEFIDHANILDITSYAGKLHKDTLKKVQRKLISELKLKWQNGTELLDRQNKVRRQETAHDPESAGTTSGRHDLQGSLAEPGQEDPGTGPITIIRANMGETKGGAYFLNHKLDISNTDITNTIINEHIDNFQERNMETIERIIEEKNERFGMRREEVLAETCGRDNHQLMAIVNNENISISGAVLTRYGRRTVFKDGLMNNPQREKGIDKHLSILVTRPCILQDIAAVNTTVTNFLNSLKIVSGAPMTLLPDGCIEQIRRMLFLNESRNNNATGTGNLTLESLYNPLCDTDFTPIMFLLSTHPERALQGLVSYDDDRGLELLLQLEGDELAHTLDFMCPMDRMHFAKFLPKDESHTPPHRRENDFYRFKSRRCYSITDWARMTNISMTCKYYPENSNSEAFVRVMTRQMVCKWENLRATERAQVHYLPWDPRIQMDYTWDGDVIPRDWSRFLANYPELKHVEFRPTSASRYNEESREVIAALSDGGGSPYDNVNDREEFLWSTQQPTGRRTRNPGSFPTPPGGPAVNERISFQSSGESISPDFKPSAQDQTGFEYQVLNPNARRKPQHRQRGECQTPEKDGWYLSATATESSSRDSEYVEFNPSDPNDLGEDEVFKTEYVQYKAVGRGQDGHKIYEKEVVKDEPYIMKDNKLVRISTSERAQYPQLVTLDESPTLKNELKEERFDRPEHHVTPRPLLEDNDLRHAIADTKRTDLRDLIDDKKKPDLRDLIKARKSSSDDQEYVEYDDDSELMDEMNLSHDTYLRKKIEQGKAARRAEKAMNPGIYGSDSSANSSLCRDYLGSKEEVKALKNAVSTIKRSRPEVSSASSSENNSPEISPNADMLSIPESLEKMEENTFNLSKQLSTNQLRTRQQKLEQELRREEKQNVEQPKRRRTDPDLPSKMDELRAKLEGVKRASDLKKKNKESTRQKNKELFAKVKETLGKSTSSEGKTNKDTIYLKRQVLLTLHGWSTQCVSSYMMLSRRWLVISNSITIYVNKPIIIIITNKFARLVARLKHTANNAFKIVVIIKTLQFCKSQIMTMSIPGNNNFFNPLYSLFNTGSTTSEKKDRRSKFSSTKDSRDTTSESEVKRSFDKSILKTNKFIHTLLTVDNLITFHKLCLYQCLFCSNKLYLPGGRSRRLQWRKRRDLLHKRLYRLNKTDSSDIRNHLFIILSLTFLSKLGEGPFVTFTKLTFIKHGCRSSNKRRLLVLRAQSFLLPVFSEFPCLKILKPFRNRGREQQWKKWTNNPQSVSRNASTYSYPSKLSSIYPHSLPDDLGHLQESENFHPPLFSLHLPFPRGPPVGHGIHGGLKEDDSG